AGLDIIPVINKIDLPAARPDDIAVELESVLGIAAEDAIFASAKTGVGVDAILRAIVERFHAPEGVGAKPLKAMIYDAKVDVHRGVVCHLRIVDGALKKGDRVRLMAAG